MQEQTNTTLIDAAISHFSYGVDNDIFKPHVMDYATLACC